MANDDVGDMFLYMYLVYLVMAVEAKHFSTDDSTNLPESIVENPLGELFAFATLSLLIRIRSE